MNVISIGTERKMFSDNPTRERVLYMGEKFEQYHIIVFALKKNGFKNEKIGNEYIYSTNSRNKLFYVFDAIKITLQIIKEFSIEEKNRTVITVQDPFECGVVGLLVSKMKKIPLHLQVHVDLYSKYFHNTLLQRIRSLIAPFVIKHAKAIRTDSLRMKTSIIKRKLSTATIEVLPIFIDVSKFVSNNPPTIDVHNIFSKDRTVVLMASRLEPEKDILNTIKVFSTVCQKYPSKLGLLIVGSGSLLTTFQNQVENLGLKEDVKFIPWTNDLQSYYKSADIFMITSIFEGYGLTIAESLLSGTPVLSTDVGVAPEIIKDGENGLICQPKDYTCLESKIELLAASRDMVSKLKENLVRNPYWHKYADPDMYSDTFVRNIASALK